MRGEDEGGCRGKDEGGGDEDEGEGGHARMRLTPSSNSVIMAPATLYVSSLVVL